MYRLGAIKRSYAILLSIAVAAAVLGGAAPALGEELLADDVAEADLQITKAAEQPEIPQNVGFEPINARSVRFTWSAPNAKEVQVYRTADPITDDSHWSFVGSYVASEGEWIYRWQMPSTTYHYRMRSYVEGGAVSDFTEPVAVTTPAMPMPESLSADVVTSGSIALSWSIPDGADAVVVQRSTDPSFAWKYTKAVGTYAPSRTQTVVNGIEPGVTYYFRARAYAYVGGNYRYSEYCDAVSAQTVLSAPVDVMSNSTEPRRVNISWTATGDPSSVEVWRYPNASADEASGVRVGTYKPSTTSMSVGSLTPSTTYYFRIRSVAGSGSNAYYSSFSPLITVKTQAPPAPTASYAAPLSNTTVELRWKSYEPSTLVEVWCSTDPSCAYDGNKKTVCTGIYYASDGYATAKRLTPGRTYYFKFRSYLIVGERRIYSGYSGVLPVTLPK